MADRHELEMEAEDFGALLRRWTAGEISREDFDETCRRRAYHVTTLEKIEYFDDVFGSLFRSCLRGEIDAATTVETMFEISHSRGIVEGDELYQLSQRLFYACEDLVLDDALRAASPRLSPAIDEPTFRAHVTRCLADLAAMKAAHATRHEESPPPAP